MIKAQKSPKALARIGLRITNYQKNHIHLTVITGVVIISNNMDHKLQLGVLVSHIGYLGKKILAKCHMRKMRYFSSCLVMTERAGYVQ